jgi:predicted nucleic acid-binding protein
VIFLDTCYLLAIVLPRDRLHHRARQWGASLTEPLATSDCVVWEAVNALSAPRNRAKAHQLVAELRGGTETTCVR